MSEQATSPVAEDTSASGVAADTTAATEHEIDRNPADYVEAEDENEAAAKARRIAEGEAADGEDAEGAAGKRKDVAEDGLVEFELNGKTYKLAPEVKDRVMADADYRQKTQALAEQRRAFETEQQTYERQREESRAALPEEYAKVAVVSDAVTRAERDVAEFEKIDWSTWRAQTAHLADDDPNKAQYKQYRAAYDAAREGLTDAQRALTTAREDLSAKEQDRQAKQQETHEGALAKARQETGAALKAEGWNEQRFADVASFAVTEFGVRPEELATAVDPRTWKMADEVMRSRQTIAKLEATLKQTKTADANLKAQESRPAEKATGNAQPLRARDDNSTETWMARREREVAAKRAAQQGKRAAAR